MLNIYNKLKTIYDKFDGAHNMNHIDTVTQNAILINNKLGNPYRDMVIFLAGLYHDIGMSIDRKTHHIESANYVLSDDDLLKLVSEEERYLIAKACEEHRASYKGEFTSLLSKIINDADSMNDKITMISRCIQYALANNTEQNISVYNEVYNHLRDKYGRNGYCKFHLEVSYEINNTEEIWRILDNEVLFEHEYYKALTILIEEGKVVVCNG